MKLKPWQSRLLALALLVLVLLGAYAAVILPLWEGYHRAKERRASLVEQIARFRAAAAQKEALQERLAALEKQEAGEASYLEEATPALAAASLQERIKGLVGRHGGTLASTQILPTSEEGELLRVAIKVQMRVVTMEALQRIVYALESQRPLLFLDNVFIRTYTRRVRQGKQLVSQTSLDMRFDLAGYIRR